MFHLLSLLFSLVHTILSDIAGQIERAEEAFFEDYQPGEFERAAFEGADTSKPTGEASPFTFTEAQRAAIEHGEGRGLIVAGPGSGKTSVLRERMFNLVQNRGVEAHRILTLAYNKEAEQELIRRSRDIGKVQIKTIHGFANKLIRENLAELGYQYAPQPAKGKDTFENFVRGIMQGESKDLVSDSDVNKVVGIVDRARASVKSGLFDPNALEGDAKRFAIAYENYKADRGLIDFQDMLLQAAHLLETSPHVRQRVQSQFDFIQIDEFQDVSEVDYRYLTNLGENILAVGDDDQTIYGFRSGAGDVMHRFADTAERYDVTENFRSHSEIVEAASQLIGHTAGSRLQKDLTSQKGAGGRVSFTETTPATIFDELAKNLPEDTQTAILVRTHNEIRALWNNLPKELQDRVSTIQTMHSTKGLEFDRVIIPLNTLEVGGGLYRSFPSIHGADNIAEQLDEERRLLYVAVTRAREETVILGNEEKFLAEMGLIEGRPDIPEIENEAKAAQKSTARLRDRMRAHYQNVRTYQDLVAMERAREVPLEDIIQDLSATQVHRQNIEEIGRRIGLKPRDRSKRARRVKFRDWLMTLPARTGQIRGLGLGGVLGGNLAGLTGGLNWGVAGGLGLAPFGLGKIGKIIDDRLYPHARRPEQNLFYDQLHEPLPDAVRAVLPSQTDLTDYRFIESRLDDPYRGEFYEFPHPDEAWAGDYSQRPLYDTEGNLVDRAAVDIDTSATSANVRVTPYDPLGGDPYRRPFRPREPAELQKAVTEHLLEFRGFLEESKQSVRRQSFWRSPKDWRAWGRRHGRLSRGVDRFLKKDFDLERASGLLGRINRERIGSQFGSDPYALGVQTTRLHNEVMDTLDDVMNPDSAFYGNARQIMAGGRLHELPDGTVASGDPDPLYAAGEGYRGRAPLRERFMGRLRRPSLPEQLKELALVIETFDEAGKRVRIGSGSYLGEGRFGTALHNLTESSDGRRAVRAVVRRLEEGARDVDVSGVLGTDPEADLAVLELDKASRELRKFRRLRLGRATSGDELFAPGLAQSAFVEMAGRSQTDTLFSGEELGLGGYESYISRGTVDFGQSERVGQFTDPFFPGQSGAPVVRKGTGLLDRLFGRYYQTGAVGGAYGRGQDRTSFYHQAEGFAKLVQSQMGATPFEQATEGLVTESDIAANIEKNIEQAQFRGGVEEVRALRGREQALYARRFAMADEPIMSGLETQIAESRQAAAAYGNEFMYGFTPETQDVDLMQAELDKRLGIREALADPLNTRGADLGRRFGRTAIGRKVSGAVTSISDFAQSPKGMKTGKVFKGVGITALKAFEGFDLLDRIEYWTGGAQERIVQEAAAGADVDEMLRWYTALQEEHGEYAEGGMSAFKRLWGGQTPFEAEYLEREGALRDIGSLHESLEPFERLPVVDPVLMLADKFEKIAADRILSMAIDPKGIHHKTELEIGLERLQPVLVEAAKTATKTQAERVRERLVSQRGLLQSELGRLGDVDMDESHKKEQKLRKKIHHVQGILESDTSRWLLYGDSPIVSYGNVAESTFETQLEELQKAYARVPHIRKADLEWRIGNLDRQIGVLDGIEYAAAEPVTTQDLALSEPEPIQLGQAPIGTLSQYAGMSPQAIAESRLVAAQTALYGQSSIQPDLSDTSAGAFRAMFAGTPDLIPNVAPVVPLTPLQTIRHAATGEYVPAGQYGQPIGEGFYFRTPDWENEAYLTIKSAQAAYDADTIKGDLSAFGEFAEGVSVRIGRPGSTLDTPELQPERGKDAEFRTPDDLERERQAGLESRDRFRKLIQDAIDRTRELGLGGPEGQIHIPLAGYTGEVGAFGRPIADMLFTHEGSGYDIAYADYAKEADIGIAWQSGFGHGVPYDKYLADFTQADRNKATKYFQKFAEKRRERGLESELERQHLPLEIMQYGYAQQLEGGTASISGLETFQGALEKRISGEQEAQRGYRDQIGKIQGRMDAMYDAQPEALLADPNFQKIFGINEEAIGDLEEKIKASEDAMKGYQKLLTQSGRTQQQLKDAVHKAELDNIKALYGQEVQQAQEVGQALGEVLAGQAEARARRPQGLAGDLDFVTGLEVANMDQLEGLGGASRVKFDEYTGMVAGQRGKVSEAFTKMDEAFKRFKTEGTIETGEAYESAKTEYNAETARLAHFQKLAALYEKQYTAAESGVEKSLQAIEASKEFFHKMQLKETVEEGLHFVSGCLLNVFAWLVIDNLAVPVPAGRLIGRPPAYVQAYTQSYQKTIQAERTKSMEEGCLINATVLFCLLPTFVF